MASSLKPFFEPKGVAIIGASDKPDKLSHGILKNLTLYGYSGGIYPVNPKTSEILGKKCYADITSVPDPVDLAVVILPAPAIPQVLEDCAKRGIKAVTVISGGFKEVGEQGRDLEKHILSITRKHGMRLIGPNCVGTLNRINGLDTTFIKGIPAKGGIGFISQSGAVGGGVVDHIMNQGIGFSHFLSLGNEVDVNETDMIEYLGEDRDTSVIAVYIEGIQDGQRFLQIGKKVTPKKPVVVLKAGRSEEGAKAVSSHTGSLAGSHAAYQAAFQQAGMIEVKTTTDLLNVCMALDWLQLPQGERCVLITNAGGPAALASDSLAEYGIRLAQVSEVTQTDLRAKLNPAAQVGNPVDMLGGATEEEYAHALDSTLKDEGVDMVLAILVPQALVNPAKVAQAIVNSAHKTKKPVMACLMGFESIQDAHKILHQNHVPMIDYPESCGAIFGALSQYASHKRQSGSARRTYSLKKDQALADSIIHTQKTKIWGEHLTRSLLQAYDIHLVDGVLTSGLREALAAANRLVYPVVLKVASEDVLHKSDFGAIAVNILNDQDLENAYRKITSSVKKHAANARIDGILVEKMAPKGLEVIIGMKRDPGFGPLMMFGMGGVFVELYKDVSFRVAPLRYQDAVAMVNATKACRLLEGWRGGERYDIEAVIRTILSLSELVTDFPQISEIEINPLLVLPENKGALALDCRMILE